MDANQSMKDDPRTIRMVEFVGKLLTLRREYGFTPTEMHVNPGDGFMNLFENVCNLRVVHDYTVPRGNLFLI